VCKNNKEVHGVCHEYLYKRNRKKPLVAARHLIAIKFVTKA
jgi:hypothetical protein